VDLGVELDGLPELVARLDHAQAGIVTVARDLEPKLQDTAPPMVVYVSPTLRPRLWGDGDVWTLPAGGWVAPRVQLPDGLEALTDHVQHLLDGN
jgi:hypothetical protein